ncbi:MAG: hypothetical protein FD138_4461, partial [Planctomycetota bacterium]
MNLQLGCRRLRGLVSVVSLVAGLALSGCSSATESNVAPNPVQLGAP